MSNQYNWEVFEWFKASSDLYHWILLVLIELKDSSEQTRFIFEEGLKDLASEIEEIYTNVQESPDEHLKIINECHNCISTPNNEDLRQSLLNKILPQTKLLDGWLPYLQQITDSQRTVLRTMAHQNIQARVAYIRAISKPYSAPEDSEGYHCTKNLYYRQAMNEKNIINIKYKDLLAKYNELLANKNAESSSSDQKSSHEDEETLPQKVGKLNEQFERELEQINKQLLENKKLDAQIVENMKENMKINDQVLKNKEINAQILENMKNSLDHAYERYKENNLCKQELEKIKSELKNAEKKALNLQAVLEEATNIRLSNESDSYLQLKKDIIKFKKLVENFIKVKGRRVQIKEQPANSLLSKYKFKKNNDTFKDDLRFILQSIIIDKVFSAIENITYRNKNGNFNYLETAIMDYANEIIEWTTKLSQTRPGNDRVTKMTPIKIRQQIYEALALRGFNNSNNKFINSIRDDIMNEMNKYREILDEGRKKAVSKHADELVRSGIKLWFCFNIQEPAVNIEWYGQGCIVDTNFMEGPWEMDDADSYRVELCYFPCIFSKGKEPEIYYKSQVTIQEISHS
nr:11208_t:CDS:1 [Entrophospora candida]